MSVGGGNMTDLEKNINHYMDIKEDNYSTMMDLGGDESDEEATELIDFSDE